MNKRRWTEAEDAILRATYPSQGAAGAARALGGTRSINSVIMRAHKLLVARQGKPLPPGSDKVTPAIRDRMRELRSTMTLRDIVIEIELEFGVELTSPTALRYVRDLPIPPRRVHSLRRVDPAAALRLMRRGIHKDFVAERLGVEVRTLHRAVRRYCDATGESFPYLRPRKIAA